MTLSHNAPPRITSQKLEINEKFLYVPPFWRKAPPPEPPGRCAPRKHWEERTEVATSSGKRRRDGGSQRNMQMPTT